MVQAKRQLKKTKRRGASPRNSNAAPRKVNAEQKKDTQASGKPNRVCRPDPADTDGAHVMLNCANQALVKISGAVVNKFAENAKNGNAASARFLFDLASKIKPGSKASAKRLEEAVARYEREIHDQDVRTVNSQSTN